MMLLELDAGNTRIKWRVLEEQQAPPECVIQNAFTMEENSKVWNDKFCNALGESAGSTISRVLVANVRGNEFKKAIIEYSRTVWNVLPEFAMSTAFCAGVTNGYNEPDKLGVDRWLAILAAFDRAKKSCCIMNCGTTVTFDLISATGMHRGGYILPGLNMMRQSLHAKSSALVTHSACEWNTFPGRDTSSAISNGILMAVAGFAVAVKSGADLIEPDSVWIISGGDGELISNHLNWESQICPSLVLDGLSLALP